MFKTLLARARQGYRTAAFPAQEPSMPALFRGRPELYQDEDPAALALGNIVFDAGRFGIEFVASPRHADGILVTGPVTANMREALNMTYEAVAEPKLVIATGACAISGGLFRGNEEVCNGVEDLLPVDLYVPGCPPHPYTILDGLLRLLGRNRRSN